MERCITESKEKALAQTTTAHKTVIALKEHTRKDLEYKFRNIHALIKRTDLFQTLSGLSSWIGPRVLTTALNTITQRLPHVS